MNWFTTDGQGGGRSGGMRPGNDAMNGNAVMYDAGMILTLGGSVGYSERAAQATAALISLNRARASVRAIGDMAFARAYCSAVALPDGKVLVVGGQPFAETFTDTDAVLEAGASASLTGWHMSICCVHIYMSMLGSLACSAAVAVYEDCSRESFAVHSLATSGAAHAEIWDPDSEEFTTLAAMAVPRTYHSVAILLPDGRVFSGGGGLCGEKCPPEGANHLNAELFSPPYLFAADGAAAMRPKIEVSGTIVVNGADLEVMANEALRIVAIVRFGSSTHSVNTDQRRIELCGPAAGACRSPAGNLYTLKIPDDPGIATSGHWMVFGVNAAGVPSVSKTIKIGAPAGGADFRGTADTVTSGDGTAAPVTATETATPANPATPMPPGKTEA